MSIFAFNSLRNGEYSNLFFIAAFSDKISLPVKNSNLLIFPDDKAEILAAFLSNSYWAWFAWFCYQLL